MITAKQRANLKSMANTLDPILIIGKNGIEENTIKQIKDSLEKRELIKIKILNSAGISDEDVLNRILRVPGWATANSSRSCGRARPRPARCTPVADRKSVV